MARRRLTAIVTGVALAALAAGCGGGEESPATAGADGGGLSKAQYVRRASAICAKHRAQISDRLAALSEKIREGNALGGAEVEEAMEDAVLPGLRSEYEELRKLLPPRGDEDFLDLMLARLSASLENGEQDVERFFHLTASGYSQFGEGTLMTEEYGLDGCGSQARSAKAVVRAYALS